MRCTCCIWAGGIINCIGGKVIFICRIFDMHVRHRKSGFLVSLSVSKIFFNHIMNFLTSCKAMLFILSFKAKMILLVITFLINAIVRRSQLCIRRCNFFAEEAIYNHTFSRFFGCSNCNFHFFILGFYNFVTNSYAGFQRIIDVFNPAFLCRVFYGVIFLRLYLSKHLAKI